MRIIICHLKTQLNCFPIIGNERVGPTSVIEAATLLLEATSCEARPKKPESSYGSSQIGDELAGAKSCRMALEQKGIDEKHRRWLARLVTTRRIVIIPTANALGYFQNTREEDGIDPNRYGVNLMIKRLPFLSPWHTSYFQRFPDRCPGRAVMHADYCWQDHQ